MNTVSSLNTNTLLQQTDVSTNMASESETTSRFSEVLASEKSERKTTENNKESSDTNESTNELAPKETKEAANDDSQKVENIDGKKKEPNKDDALTVDTETEQFIGLVVELDAQRRNVEVSTSLPTTEQLVKTDMSTQAALSLAAMQGKESTDVTLPVGEGMTMPTSTGASAEATLVAQATTNQLSTASEQPVVEVAPTLPTSNFDEVSSEALLKTMNAVDAIKTTTADVETPDIQAIPNTFAQNLAEAAVETKQAVLQISPRVDSSSWSQTLGQRMTWMVKSDVQSASISLNPPDLGPLHVVIKVSNNHANASFVSAQPEVRQVLEDAMPKLREMMGEAGIELGQSNVSAESSQQQQYFSENNKSSGSNLTVSSDVDVEADVQDVLIPVAATQKGLVDTFV